MSSCANCGKSEPSSKCSRCKTPYCSKACQKQDWKYHKKNVCQKVAKKDEKARVVRCPSTFNGTSSNEDGNLKFNDLIKFPYKGCNCGDPRCEYGKPVAMYRSQCGDPNSFLGIIQLYTGELKKLDNPRDLMHKDNIEDLPGHLMTLTEALTEFDQCDDNAKSLMKKNNLRSIGPALVDYRDFRRGNKKYVDDDTMYPFYEKLTPPFKHNPPPKVRSDDIVIVTARRNIKFSKSSMKAGETIEVYVVSLTSAGIVTGVLLNDNSLNHDEVAYLVHCPHDFDWVSFPIHHAKQLVKHGIHWKDLWGVDPPQAPAAAPLITKKAKNCHFKKDWNPPQSIVGKGSVESILAGNADIASRVFLYAVSDVSDIRPLVSTCRQWNDIINGDSHFSRTLWKSLCKAHFPELLRLYPLCIESQVATIIKEDDDCPNTIGWKALLRRRKTSLFTPSGVNQQLQRDMETVFRPEGILGFTNCCAVCTESYDDSRSDNPSFHWREGGGIYFFRFYLNGMNYCTHLDTSPFNASKSFSARSATALYEDYRYIAQNWNSECDIIRRWCSVLGLTTQEFTIKKPEQGQAIEIIFKKKIVLEDVPKELFLSSLQVRMAGRGVREATSA